jgi:hypothetical protein
MEDQKATKVTLYLPPDLHRQLRIRSAVDGEPMSSIAKRAIDFYLAHSEVVEEGFGLAQGHSHQIYACPSCETSVVVHQGNLVEVATLGRSASTTTCTLENPEISDIVAEPAQDEGELVAC